MLYNSTGTKVRVWVRTRSGTNITMVFPDAKFSFNGVWKEVELTEQQLGWIKKQNRLIEISMVNPNVVQGKPKTKISLQGITLKPEAVTMVVGDNIDLVLEYTPSDVESSKYNPDILSENVKIASTKTKNSRISLTAHAVGTTRINAILGTMKSSTEVTVIAEPKFDLSEYTGLVGENVVLASNCNSAISLTVPEHVSVVEGNTVMADAEGVYDILASAYGKTFTTKLVVSNPTGTTTE